MTRAAPPEAERLRAQVAALEQLLEVHERTTIEQSEKLEEALRASAARAEELRRLGEQQAFLAEAGRLFSTSLDVEATLSHLARLAVPRIADWCAIDVLDARGHPRRVVVAHADPAKEELARRLEERYPSDPDAPTGVPQVLRTGEPEMIPEIPEELIRQAAKDEEHLRLIEQLQLRSYMVVPLKARGHVLGAITLVGAESGTRYDEDDLQFATELAARAAIAADNARLYQEAEQRATELARLARALEVSNRELDQFAYVASHDLKAPLRGIANLSQWLEEDMEGELDAEAKEHLDLLRGRVHRMEGLIDGILEYSRAARVREKPEVVNVGALVHDVVDLLAPPEGFTVEVGDGMPTLTTEKLPLQQVFMNLVGNAVKYTRRPDARVEVAVEGGGEGGFYEFRVSDNGPGIAPEYHERIFGIFQTLEARDKVEGTGIGLSLVKKIVENRGGRIWLESEEGAGAAFHFLWPRTTDEDS